MSGFNGFNPGDKRLKLLMFIRGAVSEFTRTTPLTPEDLAWALAFGAGSAIGQPEAAKHFAPGMTVKKMRDHAIIALDAGLDSAKRASAPVLEIPPGMKAN